MGNNSSSENDEKKESDKNKNLPIKSAIKYRPQKTINDFKVVKKKVSEKKPDSPINKIPNYHLTHKAQINSGVNEYQYFNQPIPSEDISNKFGINTQQDNKYSHNINKLYEQEIDYRTNIDCSKELPVTAHDIENTLNYKSDSININTNIKNTANNVSNMNNLSDKRNLNNKNTTDDLQGGDDNGFVEITITREQALEIKDCRYLSDLEKRILIMNSITLNQIDPLKMIAEQKIRLSVLTDKYKSLLKICHPDRAGASSHDMFVTVKNAFDKQQYVINSKIMDKDYNQLKQDYGEYSQNVKKKKPVFFNGEDSVDSFDAKKFNQFYDENKYDDEYEDDGYGDMMIENGVREDIEIEKIEITKDNTFQDQFNKKLNEKNNEIIRYQVPKAINQNESYSQLCQKTTNYSGNNANVNCFDYKEAFELMNIDRNQPTKNMTIEEYKESRKNDSLELTDEQKNEIEKDELEQDNKEKNRQNNMVDYSNSLERFNFKINKIMIEN